MRSRRRRSAAASASDTDLTADDLREVAREFGGIVREEAGRDFPSDPWEQLDLAIRAVFASWFGRRARDYRAFNDIADDLGTAVNVMTMVFGNMGEDSGTGVAFTRDPNTGERRLFGEFLTNAQGEDVVAGIRTPRSISEMRDEMPAVYDEFQRIAERLERHYRDVQDLEFTIERGRLFMLQTRSAKRTAAAAVKIAADMADERIISRTEALQRIEPAKRRAAAAQPVRPLGARTAATVHRARPERVARCGRRPGAVFDADRAAEAAGRGEKVVLVRIETSPDDFHGMAVSQGVLTARGGATSHAAVVARQIGKPCVAGVGELTHRPARTDGARRRPDARRRGTGSASTARPARCSWARCPTVEVQLRGAGRACGGSWTGPTRSAGSRSGRTPTSPRRRPWRGASAPRASASAARSTCSARANASTSSATRSSSPSQATRAKQKRAAGGELIDAETAGRVERFDAAMGKLERLQEGDFRGHLRGDERAAGRQSG